MPTYGDCVISRGLGGDLRVEQADEDILISRELLDAALCGAPEGEGVRPTGDGDIEVAGQVVYRLLGPCPWRGPGWVRARRVTAWP